MSAWPIPLRHQAGSTFILAGEDEDRVTPGDALAAVHRFLRWEYECLRRRIGHLGFDRKDPARFAVFSRFRGHEEFPR